MKIRKSTSRMDIPIEKRKTLFDAFFNADSKYIIIVS